MKYFLFISLSSFLFCCNNKQNSEGKLLKETSSQTSSAQTKEIKQEEEIDNEVLYNPQNEMYQFSKRNVHFLSA